MQDELLEKVIVWLAGLLSTDGSVFRGDKHAIRYRIYSTERIWLEQIANMLDAVNIKSRIHQMSQSKLSGVTEYMLLLLNPHRVTSLLKEYAEGFMMERKWQIVILGYPKGTRPWSNTDRIRKFKPWTPEEDKILVENYRKLTYEKLGKKLGRGGKSNIEWRIKHLKISDIIPNRDYRKKGWKIE